MLAVLSSTQDCNCHKNILCAFPWYLRYSHSKLRFHMLRNINHQDDKTLMRTALVVYQLFIITQVQFYK